MRDRKIRHAERGFGYSLFSGLWNEMGKGGAGGREGGGKSRGEEKRQQLAL